MTSQYVTEPPTQGKILLVTSKGDIEVELFAKETPKACRNILTLALEGFYDRQIFHRLIPGFIIQTGDPSGTGMGGESIYGEPFPTEPHSRLKFNRRGLLAMAAEDGVNESQFFITLDATPELQGKHTLFGRVVGNTIYNALALAECEMDKQNPDRPRYPPKLIEIKVLENPFDDLKPRATKEERKREDRIRREEEQKRLKEASKKKNKKNTSLLSFGDEEDTGAESFKGPKSSHDLLKDDKKLSKQSALAIEGSSSEIEPARKKRKEEEKRSQHQDATPSSSRASAHHSVPSSSAEPTSSRRTNGTGTHAEPSASTSTSMTGTDVTASKMKESRSADSAKEFLSQTRAKYAKAKKDKSDAYDALLSFQSRMRASASRRESAAGAKDAGQSNGVGAGANGEQEQAEEEEVAKEYGASDDDSDWRNHTFDAGGKPLVGNDKYSVEDYEVLDPRQHAQNTEKNGDRDRDRGKRGRDWVEERTYRGNHHDSRQRSQRDYNSNRDRPNRDHERRDKRDYADDRRPPSHRRDERRR